MKMESVRLLLHLLKIEDRRKTLASVLLAWLLVSLFSAICNLESTMPAELFGSRIGWEHWLVMGLWILALVGVDVALWRAKTPTGAAMFTLYWVFCLGVIFWNVLSGNPDLVRWSLLGATPMIHLAPLWVSDRVWDWPLSFAQCGILLGLAAQTYVCVRALMKSLPGKQESGEQNAGTVEP